MTYAFRLRFFVHGSRLGSDESTIEIKLPDGTVVDLAPAKLSHRDPDEKEDDSSKSPPIKLRDTNELRICGRGFATEDEARRCGERVRDAVRKSSAELKMGFDLGKDRPTSRTSTMVKEAVRAKGFKLLDNVHGLMVYEQDLPAGVFSLSATAFVSVPPERVIDEWTRQYALGPKLKDPRELLAFELYGAVWMEPFLRAKFLTLVSVVEVLAMRGPRSQEAVALIDRFMADATVLTEPERTSVFQALGQMKTESIRSACRRYVQGALGEADWKELDRLYGIRSTMAHEGDVPAGVEIGDEVTKLTDIVARLLSRLG